MPPCTSALMQSPPNRSVLYGPDRSGHMACKRDKRVDNANHSLPGVPERACRNDATGPVTRTWAVSSVQGNSYRGFQCKAIQQLSHVMPNVRMRPLRPPEPGRAGPGPNCRAQAVSPHLLSFLLIISSSSGLCVCVCVCM